MSVLAACAIPFPWRRFFISLWSCTSWKDLRRTWDGASAENQLGILAPSLQNVQITSNNMSCQSPVMPRGRKISKRPRRLLRRCQAQQMCPRFQKQRVSRFSDDWCSRVLVQQMFFPHLPGESCYCRFYQNCSSPPSSSFSSSASSSSTTSTSTVALPTLRQLRSSVRAADLNLGPSQLSAHRWTSTWGLPSSVRTAGPQKPNRMPEDMPDRMSDRMREDMPDKMP